MSGGRVRIVVAGGVALAAMLATVLVAWPRPAASGDPAAGETVKATATCGQFQLELSFPRSTWRTAEAVDGRATFRYLGSGTGHWSGSSGGPVGFEYRQLDGKIDIGPAWSLDLVVHEIAASNPLVTSLTKSGGYTAEDPLASFYAAFLAEREVHLPAGLWEISAVSDHGCTESSPALQATVRIRVVP